MCKDSVNTHIVLSAATVASKMEKYPFRETVHIKTGADSANDSRMVSVSGWDSTVVEQSKVQIKCCRFANEFGTRSLEFPANSHFTKNTWGSSHGLPSSITFLKANKTTFWQTFEKIHYGSDVTKNINSV